MNLPSESSVGLELLQMLLTSQPLASALVTQLTQLSFYAHAPIRDDS